MRHLDLGHLWLQAAVRDKQVQKYSHATIWQTFVRSCLSGHEESGVSCSSGGVNGQRHMHISAELSLVQSFETLRKGIKTPLLVELDRERQHTSGMTLVLWFEACQTEPPTKNAGNSTVEPLLLQRQQGQQGHEHDCNSQDVMCCLTALVLAN